MLVYCVLVGAGGSRRRSRSLSATQIFAAGRSQRRKFTRSKVSPKISGRPMAHFRRRPADAAVPSWRS
jgi:hypothetical protein